MKKQVNYIEIAKETVILTAAVAVIAAAVYFFLVPSHTSVSSISGLGIVLSNFIPLPCGASGHRIFYLWKGIWGKDRLYQHYAPRVFRDI